MMQKGQDGGLMTSLPFIDIVIRGWRMLEIVIAICLIYALFAGMVSSLTELISQMLSMRGRVLFEGLVMMLEEDESHPGVPGFLRPFLSQDAALVEKLYKHPLIDSLSPAGSSRPSYISPQIFSAALVQILSHDGSLSGLRQALDDRTTWVGRLLGPMLDEAAGDLEQFKIRVEAHFNAVSDRVSGWFKRRTQVAMFVVGFLLAILFNVDSIYIFQHLEKNPTLVKSLVEQAKNIEADQKQPQPQPQPQPQQQTPVAANVTVGDTHKSAVSMQDFQGKLKNLERQISDFEQMGLPIGWYSPQAQTEAGSGVWSYIVSQFMEPMKWIGWLITAIAGVLGAPFWFDAISKLFAIRGAGRKPEEATPSATVPAPVTVQVSAPAVSNIPPQDVPLNDYEASRLNGDDIEGLQRALGLAPSQITGKLSTELRQSLREWQRSSGRAVTGQFDEATVLALLYSSAKGE